MSLNFPYTINGLNNIDVDDVSCDTFLNQPSSYFTGITSNLQTQLNNVYTKSASDSKYITQTQLTTQINTTTDNIISEVNDLISTYDSNDVQPIRDNITTVINPSITALQNNITTLQNKTQAQSYDPTQQLTIFTNNLQVNNRKSEHLYLF